jgi:chromosome segregation ATPase
VPCRERDEARAAVAGVEAQRDALAAQLAALQGQLQGFVRGNIDHMLAWRELQDRAAALQGRADSLAAANAALHAGAAQAAARERALQERGEGLAARLAAAEADAAARGAAMHDLDAVLKEKDELLRKQYRQARALVVGGIWARRAACARRVCEGVGALGGVCAPAAARR